MIWRKNYFLFLGVFGLTFFLGLILLRVAYAGTLSCSITTDCSGGTVIFRMKNTTNSHAGMPVGSSYTNLVCCTGVTGLGNSCTEGVHNTVLRLSSANNAHVRQATHPSGDYPGSNNACISVPTGGNISVGYQSGNCDGYEATLACMSGTTNAHVDNCTTYSTRICATASATAPVVSVSVSDGVVSYGTMPANTSKSTLPGELNDMQTATNDGNVVENFNIKSQDASGGGCTWTLASTNGSDQYVHSFCNDTDLNCSSPPTNYTALTSSYQTLDTGISVSGTTQFQLRLTTPNPSTCYGQQTVNVTIQATQ